MTLFQGGSVYLRIDRPHAHGLICPGIQLRQVPKSADDGNYLEPTLTRNLASTHPQTSSVVP